MSSYRGNLFRVTFTSFVIICFMAWVVTMFMYAYLHCKNIAFEAYWNFVTEDQFLDKLKIIIRDINPNYFIFSNRNLLYKINYIYNRMNSVEKSEFKIAIFQNGMKKKIKTIIENY